MKKRVISLALAVILVAGLAVPALAAGPTFSDVPESYWGYADIEAVAEAGLMNGTGNGEFSPEMKVSVAQFLTLVGRLVFPETKVEEGDTWFGPYVAKAQETGLLAGTQGNVNDVEAEISRYDMAVILRSAAKKLGVAEKAAQSGEVTDYGMVPNMYTDAVLAVYGMGLIKGDQAGNFNGFNTMTRAEVATVIMRLAKAKPNHDAQGGETDPEPSKDPEPSSDPEPSKDPEPIEMYIPKTSNTETYTVNGNVRGKRAVTVAMSGIQVGFFHRDGRLLAQTVTDSNGKWSVEITVDAADCREYFYVSLLAPFEYEGHQYTRSSNATWTFTSREDGWSLDVL